MSNNNSNDNNNNDKNNDRESTQKMERQMEVVTFLMNARAEGRATNDEVDMAVDRLLELQQQQEEYNSSTSDFVYQVLQQQAHQKYSTNKRNDEAEDTSIIPDTENYDDDDNDDDKLIAKQLHEGIENKEIPIEEPTKKKRGRTPNSNNETTTPTATLKKIDYRIYDKIPLGRQGAQMMTTFGDGRYPKVDTVQLTLEGTRRLLQVTIQDARYIRRKQKNLYQAAKKYVRDKKNILVVPSPSQQQQQQVTATCATSSSSSSNSIQKQQQQLQGEFSSELLFRANESYDRLSWDPKCGFDIEELRLLYQEEMNEFHKWIELHEETQADADEKITSTSTGTTNDNDDDDSTNTKKKDNNMYEYHTNGGHLRKRAEQFDIRTDKMKDDWYIHFSEIRKGSFIPRGGGKVTASTIDDNDDHDDSNIDIDDDNDDTDTKRSSKKQRRRQGRPRSKGGNHQGTWFNLSKNSIRFLYWVGFDPNSALPPPDDFTTQALAFLGYNFFGRIVEKAISIRIERTNKTNTNKNINGNSHTNNEIILELEAGEQLDVTDIQLALQVPDFNQQPLCSNTTTGTTTGSSTGTSAKTDSSRMFTGQLYFGPGFEDRVELEMEELVRTIRSEDIETLPDDEILFRQKEDELFSNLAATTPTSDNTTLPTNITK